MAIEIRELVIKAVVSQGDASASPVASASLAGPQEPGDQNQLQESVEQILQILRDKNER